LHLIAPRKLQQIVCANDISPKGSHRVGIELASGGGAGRMEDEIELSWRRNRLNNIADHQLKIVSAQIGPEPSSHRVWISDHGQNAAPITQGLVI
jgi:hypothetical protein